MTSNHVQSNVDGKDEVAAMKECHSQSNSLAYTHLRKKTRLSQEELEATMRLIAQEKEQLLTEAEDFINNIRNSFYLYANAEQERVARAADEVLNGLVQGIALPFFERSGDHVMSTLFAQTIDEWKEKENAIMQEMRRLQCLLKGDFDAIESNGQVTDHVEVEAGDKHDLNN